jgi:hypothetical protein
VLLCRMTGDCGNAALVTPMVSDKLVRGVQHGWKLIPQSTTHLHPYVRTIHVYHDVVMQIVSSLRARAG